MKDLILFFLMVFCSTSYAQITKQWQTGPIMEVPESVKCYAKENCLFVSNIVGKPADKDGNGYISKLSADGKVISQKWLVGLDAPKGMAINDGVLYVSNIDELVAIDIEKAEILTRVKQSDAKFLNDVTVASNGKVFVSDSATGIVYLLFKGELVVWLQKEGVVGVNGLYAEHDYVLVGTNTNILKVDIDTREMSVFVETTGQVDGLEADGYGGYYYSYWKGELFYFKLGNEPVQLLNSSVDNVQSADIGYNPNTNEVLVPTFFSNEVVSYLKD